jgi:class 3 adenylate cyclase
MAFSGNLGIRADPGRPMSAIRRLAAILAADVAGYSRLMGADEEGTLERLKALRRELLDPKIAEHRGCRGRRPAPGSRKDLALFG